MERIKSLRREVSKRRSLNKLKIDMAKPTITNVERIISYMAKDLKEINLAEVDPSEYLKFNHFEIQVQKVGNSSLANRITKKFAKEATTVYEVTLMGMGEDSIDIYVMPTVKVPKSAKKYTYAVPNITDRKKILDIGYLYGLLKTLDLVYEEVNERIDFFLSPEFKNVSLYKNSYKEEEIKGLLNIPFITNMTLYCLRGKSFELYSGAMRLIVDIAAVMQTIDCNVELTEKYNADANSECARAFETKKNIPDKVLRVMNNTNFLEDFSYVEIDEGTDLAKFKVIEREWKKVKKALNLDKYLDTIRPELRFRKLGKHRALGLYYPSLKCICVDTSSPSSFIHEVGHFIDYTNKDGQLSLQLDFFPLISEYKLAYNKYVAANAETEQGKYLIRKTNYFFTPTEIFARCLEIYLVDKGVRTSFLKDKSDLNMSSGYPECSDYFMELIRNYYDKFITLDLDVLKETNLPNKVDKNKIKYVEPVASVSGQLKFVI